jgi:YfiH family protein
MGKGGEAGKRDGAKVNRTRGAESAPFVASVVREAPVPGAIPRFEIPTWQEDYGVIAGITGRGSEPGRGFDLGLWSSEPVGDVMSRWLAFRRGLAGFHAVVLGNQVHGVEVATIESGRGWIQMEGIDGWISTTPGILLTVTVADCVPVYLVAPGRGIALLHAGWRGTAGGILRRGLERLKAETGSPSADILMHCGVAICGECYEVGSEVIEGCGVPAEGSGPWHLDLRARLLAQGQAMGLTLSSVSPWCSAHDRKSFYSHRGSAGADGRMVAYMGMTRRGASSK